METRAGKELAHHREDRRGPVASKRSSVSVERPRDASASEAVSLAPAPSYPPSMIRGWCSSSPIPLYPAFTILRSKVGQSPDLETARTWISF